MLMILFLGGVTMLDRLWQKTKRIALGAFGFIVMVLVVMVLSPEADSRRSPGGSYRR